jgi:plasmid rolling circle replication initiator protein Rep
MKTTKKEKKSQHKFHQDNQCGNGHVLKDLKKSGKRRPWKKRKDMSCAVARALAQIPELKKYGDAIEACGNYLLFGECRTAEHGKLLLDAYFCKCRLCTMCQSRRSSVVKNQVLDLALLHLEKRKTDVPLLLTLTTPNVLGCDLNKGIDGMNGGFKKLMRKTRVAEAVTSWARFFEITRNNERDDYHPHFHVLLMVPQRYFREESGLYIPRDEWLKLWQESMGDDRITQVDIRTGKKGKNGGLEGMIAEVAKYATKPLSFINEDEEGKFWADPKVASELFYALKGRRLMGFGGEFRKIRQEKKMEAIELVDLVTLGEMSSDSKDVENSDVADVEVDKRFKCNHKTNDGICGFDLRTNKKRYDWNPVKRNFFLRWSEVNGFVDSG